MRNFENSHVGVVGRHLVGRHIIGHFLSTAVFGALAQAIPDRVLADGAAKARLVAEKVLKRARKNCGLE